MSSFVYKACVRLYFQRNCRPDVVIWTTILIFILNIGCAVFPKKICRAFDILNKNLIYSTEISSMVHGEYIVLHRLS